METIATIRKFRRKNFTVVVRAVEDNDLDLSFDNTGETARGLNSGRLMGFGVIAEVFFDGVAIGEDSLWGCIYESPRDFMDHFGTRPQERALSFQRGSRVSICCYFSGMVREAIEQARKNLGEMQAVYVRKEAL